MTSGPSPCSAICSRMPLVSTMRCVTSGIAGSTQDAGSGPSPPGSAAPAPDGAENAALIVSAPAAQSMSRRDNVASLVVLVIARLLVASLMYERLGKATMRANGDGL